MVEFRKYGLGLRIEGIPAAGGSSLPALFWCGDGPIRGMGIQGAERVLVEVPPALDASVDLATGQIDLQSTTFALSATESVCKRLLVRGGSVYQAELAFEVNPISTLIVVRSRRPIEPSEHLYVGNETVFVQSIESVTGRDYSIRVTRGAVESQKQSHGMGARVAFSPPYMKWRSVTLLALDFSARTTREIWHGLVDSVATDDAQTSVIVGVSDTLSALWGAKGGAQTPMPDYDLYWRSDGYLSGTVNLENTVVDWPNEATIWPNIRIGDVAYRMGREGSQLVPKSRPCWDTHPDVDPDNNGQVATEKVDGEDITAYLAWCRRDLVPARAAVSNDLTGVYGVDDNSAHPVSVALSLLLSTGAGANNLYDAASSQTRVFDVLGASWGMGVPARLVDAESWLRAIDEVPATIDQIVLGWDGPFDFSEVVLKKLLVAHNFYPYPTNTGLVGLRHMATWSVADMADVLESASTVTLHPTRIELDLRLAAYSPQIKATVGGMAPEESPDRVRIQATDGYRRDTVIGQTPHELDLSAHDKLAYRLDTSEIRMRVADELEKRRDNPPVITCEVPMESAGGVEVLPPVLSWVRVTGGPVDGLIGPNGVRIRPESTQITFIGILIGRTWDFESGDCECRVLLSNWWLGDRVPRLIAPVAEVTHYNSVGPWHYEIDGRLESVGGGHGFTSGDQVQLIEPGGRRSYLDPGDLTISIHGDLDPRINLHSSDTLFSTDVAGLIVTLADASLYESAAWSGSDGYTDPDVVGRRFAYLADDAGQIHTPLGPVDADIYA